VSADEILTAPPHVMYKDILISRKSGSNDERSGHSLRLGRTDTLDDSDSRSFHGNDLLRNGTYTGREVVVYQVGIGSGNEMA
jgi:hypothetical protein